MKRSEASRRAWVAVMLCLAFGAVVNLGVAWALAAWSASGASSMFSSSGGFSMSRSSGETGYRVSYARVTINSGGAGWDLHATDRSTGSGRYEHRFEWTAGWPLRAVYAVDRGSSTQPALGSSLGFKSNAAIDPPHGLVRGIRLANSRRLPLIPMWPGFLINTLGFAAAPFAVVGLLAWRRSRRRPEGCCPACGYPIGTSPVCTECGAPVAPAA